MEKGKHIRGKKWRKEKGILWISKDKGGREEGRGTK